MRLTILFLIILFPLHASFAQEADSTVSSETYEEAVDETDYEYDEQETVSHTLVNPADLGKTKEYTTEKIAVRKFDQNKWKEIIGTTNYEEVKEKKPEPKEQGNSGINIPWSSAPLQVISYILIIAAVVFIIYYISKNTKLDYKVEKQEIHAEDYASTVENIEDIDIHTLLQRTLAEGNFKLAVRMYFLGLLKKLNESGAIIWKKDKTNRDYLTELFSKNYHFDDVQRLTLAYEEVWYGEHILATESYQKLFAEFERINQKIVTPNES